VLLEQLLQAETEERSRRSLERRLRVSAIKSFKPMADFDWTWPTKVTFLAEYEPTGETIEAETYCV